MAETPGRAEDMMGVVGHPFWVQWKMVLVIEVEVEVEVAGSMVRQP